MHVLRALEPDIPLTHERSTGPSLETSLSDVFISVLYVQIHAVCFVYILRVSCWSRHSAFGTTGAKTTASAHAEGTCR